MRIHPLVLALAAVASLVPPLSAYAQLVPDTPAGGSYRPSVPVSAFARPGAWLDSQRLNVSAEVMVGTGMDGRGMSGLQVTRLSYQLAAPLAVRLSIGNAFGGGSLRSSQAGGAGSFFLEGFDVSYQPFPSLLVQVHYQDVRSPLQLSRPGAFSVR